VRAESWVMGRYAAPVSDLLPNLDALIDELPGSTPGTKDARALAEAVTVASTIEELDQALSRVAATWRQP
jgi:hypothetical protein